MKPHTLYVLMLIAAILFPFEHLSQTPATVYFFPGQGSDERIFSKISLPDNFKAVHIHYPVPLRKDNMETFAARLIEQIDTTGVYYFVGVSLGGMISVELCRRLRPRKVILVSSAKNRAELPFRYRFQKYIPLYRCLPPSLVKAGALFLQPLVEPDRNREKQVFKKMLLAKNKKYLKRSIGLIVNWKNNYHTCPALYHIHGTRDHTLPARKLKADTLIQNGSHMMTLTRGNEINLLINQLLMK